MNKLIRFIVIIITLSFLLLEMHCQNVKILGSVRSNNTEILPYANLYNINNQTGTVSNEEGQYLLIANINDTIQFSYIGHAKLVLPVSKLVNNNEVVLNENIIHLKEATITNDNLSAKAIIKKVLDNYKVNYPEADVKQEAFIRIRDKMAYDKVHIDHIQSTVKLIDEEYTRELSKEISQPILSFTDLYGNLLYAPSNTSGLSFSIEPVKAVELREKDMFKMSRVDSIAKQLFIHKDTNTYWKFRSGLLPVSVEFSERDSLNNDSIKLLRAKLLNKNIQESIAMSRFSQKRSWDFLHRTSRYIYKLEGRTQFNDKMVYVISFEPKSSGLYRGRLYICKNDFAILKASYEFAEGKSGKNIKLLGVGYNEQEYRASVQYEKYNEGYGLKYFSLTNNIELLVDRPLSMKRKQERSLFDKTLDKVKVNVNVDMQTVHQFEVIIFNQQKLNKEKYSELKIKPMDILQVTQFNDSLWQDFNIIEPTRQMREYKKSMN